MPDLGAGEAVEHQATDCADVVGSGALDDVAAPDEIRLSPGWFVADFAHTVRT